MWYKSTETSSVWLMYLNWAADDCAAFTIHIEEVVIVMAP